jgi:sugar phosphate isomerase/epimerase
MTEPLTDFMRVGFVHFMLYPQCMGGGGPVFETVRMLAKDDDFSVVEVTKINDASVRKDVRALAEDTNTTLCFGAQPILLGGKLNLNHPDAAERQKAIDAVVQGFDQAVELGCPSAAVLSGPVSGDADAATERLIDSLNVLCDAADTRGLTVALETFDRVPFGKNCLIGPTPEAVRVSEAVRQSHPSFGLMLDLSHLPLLNEASAFAIDTAGGHLVHAHIGNCAMDDPEHPAYGDNHPPFGAPGTRNDVPELAEYLRALVASGYLTKDNHRIVSFEIKPMAGDDPELVVANSKHKLFEAWMNA